MALGLLAAVAMAGCGGSQSPRGNVKPRVIIEGTSLLLVDDNSNDFIPIEIPFEVASHVLDESSHGALDVLADFLEANAAYELIEVQGHSDERGTDAYNLALSKRRAESVVDYLVSRGVDRARLRAKGFGANRPAARGTNESAWSQNRRVEFVILKQSAP